MKKESLELLLKGLNIDSNNNLVTIIKLLNEEIERLKEEMEKRMKNKKVDDDDDPYDFQVDNPMIDLQNATILQEEDGEV